MHNVEYNSVIPSVKEVIFYLVFVWPVCLSVSNFT